MSNTQRMLENAERRLVVSERICMQQETDIVNARNDARKAEATLAHLQKWHNKSKWQKIWDLL